MGRILVSDSNRKFKNILLEKQIQEGIDFAVCLSAAIMGIYNLLFFLFRKKDPAPLWFSIYCILTLIRTLATGERLGHLFFPSLSWELWNRLEYSSIYLAGPASYAFFNRLCPTKFWERFGIFVNLPYFIFASIVLIFPNPIYTLTLNPVLFYAFFVTVPGWLILLVYGIYKKYEGAWILCLSYVWAFFCTEHDILYSMGFFESRYLIQFGLIALIASYSILISKRFSNSLNRSENLSEKMKSLVSSTREIMTSPSFTSAAQTALEILSKNAQDHSKISSSIFKKNENKRISDFFRNNFV